MYAVYHLVTHLQGNFSTMELETTTGCWPSTGMLRGATEMGVEEVGVAGRVEGVEDVRVWSRL